MSVIVLKRVFVFVYRLLIAMRLQCFPDQRAFWAKIVESHSEERGSTFGASLLTKATYGRGFNSGGFVSRGSGSLARVTPPPAAFSFCDDFVISCFGVLRLDATGTERQSLATLSQTNRLDTLFSGKV